jgi:hypothetical protein
MADKRDEREREEDEEKPKIQVVDRRMLSEEERSGAASGETAPGETASGNETAPEAVSERPRLEMLDGGKAEAQDTEADDEPLSAAEEAELRAEVEKVEQEQFAALEQQIGRPLTEQEKQAVRDQMEEQARSAAALEIAPVLQQMLGEMHARATVHLGLMPNPYTRLIARNDAEARLAIDTFAALLELLRPRLEPHIQSEFERVLNDLRVNYVTVTGTQPGSGPGSRIIH